MGKENITEKIELPESVEAVLDNQSVVLKGPKGEDSEKIPRKIFVKAEGNTIVISAVNATKREKKLIGTVRANLKNMIKGVSVGHAYKMKICSGHFPMNVSVSGSELVIKNFFGEKVPRKLKIPEKVSVKVQGDEITIESHSKRLAGQTAASIEAITSRSDYDRRVFQDGIYIISKDGKILS